MYVALECSRCHGTEGRGDGPDCVAEFADDNVTPEDARGFMRNRYPNALQMDGQGPQAKLQLNSDIDPKCVSIINANCMAVSTADK